MQLQSHMPRRRGTAFAFAVLALSGCAIPQPYGPPIPDSGMPYQAGAARASAPRSDEVTATSTSTPASTSTSTSSSTATTVTTAPSIRSPLALPTRFRSRADSLAWADAWRRAKSDTGLRVVVSLDAHALWLLDGHDTLRLARVAIGTEKRLVHGRHEWVFETPRGLRRVQGKAVDPAWTPPLWHFVEVANRHGLTLAVMPPNGRVSLPGGERLEVRDSLVGRWTPDRGWRAWPLDDEIVVDGTLYMPPIGTKNRIQHGQLGPFKLDVGDGYLIHGSPDPASIGRAATHGCIRLSDEDLQFVYDLVPVGTPVYIL